MEPQSHIDFHYYTQDHLGNIREVVAEDGTLEQVTDYYPFGTPYSDNTGRNPSFQPYKFGAKELDLTHGYIAYDFGARRYNSLLCTWDRIDPMCEKYNDMSPYAYCGDNPINAIDKEGRLIVFINGFNVGDGGKSAYWEGFDNAIRQHFNENRASLYYDGSIGGPFGLSPTTIGNQISLNYHTEKLRPSSYYAGTRYEMGYESGKFAVKAICVIRPNPVHFPGALQGSSEV